MVCLYDRFEASHRSTKVSSVCRPFELWSRTFTLIGTAATLACSTGATSVQAEPEHATVDECSCAPAEKVSSCSKTGGALPADEVLKRGGRLAGKPVSLRGTIIRDWPIDETGAEQPPRCDRDANLHVLAFATGDQKFAKNVAQSDRDTLEHVPMCEYAILIDPAVFACKPEACCPIETQAEVIASGTLARHDCGFRLEEPTLCVPGSDEE
jgi:hypothetical protein